MSHAATSRSVPRSPEPDERWAEQGRALGERLSATRWDIGDWALAVPAGVLDDVAAETAGIQTGVLRTCRWLSRRFAAARRRSELGHCHHIEVAALPEEIGDALLDQATSEGWSVLQLRAAARAAGSQAEIDRASAAAVRERQAAASREWLVDARRTERECQERLLAAQKELRLAMDAVDALAEHPRRGAVHGNRVRGVVDRLRAIVAPASAAAEHFAARVGTRLARLQRART